MMIIVQSKDHSNKTFRISTGEVINCDIEGIACVSEEACDLLMTKYSFKGFSMVEGQFDVSVETDLPEPEGGYIDPVSETETPEQIEYVTEIDKGHDESEEGSEDVSIESVIENCDAIDELKSIAKELGLPEVEWEGYKRKDYFKKYLIEKLNGE